MFRVTGHFGEESLELIEVRTPRLAIKAALEMARRGRERIAIGRRGSGSRLGMEDFAKRHGLTLTELSAEFADPAAPAT